jgi:peptidoglycan-associated lipoprotein
VRRGLILAATALSLGACAQVSEMRTRAQIVAEPHCADINFPIYFGERSSELTPAAMNVIASAGTHSRGCTAAEVEVVGLADYQGPADANLELSRQRAAKVAAALTHAGLPAPVFHLTAAGDTGAVTAGGDAKPLRRRADVIIRFKS